MKGIRWRCYRGAAKLLSEENTVVSNLETKQFSRPLSSPLSPDFYSVMNRYAGGKFPASEYPEYRRNLLEIDDPDRLSAALAEGFCAECRPLLQHRLRLLFIPATNQRLYPLEFTPENYHHDCNSEISRYSEEDTPERHYRHCRSPKRVSYRAGREHRGGCSPIVENMMRKIGFYECSDADLILDDGIARFPSNWDGGISEEQKEKLRFLRVKKVEFVHLERIDGKLRNILQGLELHTGVFNQEEQKNIVDFVYLLQNMGQRGQLRNRTYSEPRKWMQGKGRVTIQFGCCYNYATDKNGTPPGIVRDEEVDPLPSLFKKMIKRMVKWHILPNACVPDSCIVNIYEEGDCIPPHIDHHDFLRPFCTVSFLTESNILFGSQLEILSPGEFFGPVSIPLPEGSVFILSGNGADLAKHCVPSVSAKRISITFRKMDDRKLPFRFLPDLELQRIKPLDLSQLKEEERKNVELDEVEIRQRDHHQYYSPKPLNLISQWQEEKNKQVKEGERKPRCHHYNDSEDFSHSQKEEYNVEVIEWERKQRGHHQSKRQRFLQGGVW